MRYDVFDIHFDTLVLIHSFRIDIRANIFLQQDIFFDMDNGNEV
jgi:hypothetical protein